MSSDDEDGGTERTLAKSEASSGLNRPKADKPRVKKDKDDKERILEEEVEPAPVMRILKLNKPEWPYLFFGSVAAIIDGLFPLALALILSESLVVFALRDEEKVKKESVFWALMFIVVGVTRFLANVIQHSLLAKSGELLTLRLRKMAFEAMLKQDMSLFDDPLHSTGALTTALSTHASAVRGASGSRLATVIASISTAVACTVFAFFHGWKLTLVVLSCVPLLIVANAITMKMTVGASISDGGEDTHVQSGKIAVETIENIRTVVSLVKECTFFDKYAQALVVTYKKALRRAYLQGASFGLAGAFMFFANASVFKYGGHLVVKGEMTMDQVMK